MIFLYQHGCYAQHTADLSSSVVSATADHRSVVLLSLPARMNIGGENTGILVSLYHFASDSYRIPHLMTKYKKMLLLIALVVSVTIVDLFFFSNKKEQSSALDESIARGQKIYDQYCLSCHQANGSGVPHLNPPLIKTSSVLGDPSILIKIVQEGLSGVKINGEIYNNPMPPFGKTLNEEQTANVLTYIRNSFGNKAGIVSADHVKAVNISR